jgi:RNA-binding protein
MNKRSEKIVLTPESIRSLKSAAHHLKPSIQIGKKGVTNALIEELSNALNVHELIKVQILSQVKSETSEHDINRLCHESGATLISRLGNIVILFKQKEEDSKYNF